MSGPSPLDVMLQALRWGPPSLAALLEAVQDSEWMADFLALVREYLPQHETEIITEQYTNERIGLYIRYFSEEYFTLDDCYLQTAYEEGEPLLPELLSYVTPQVCGFSEDDYHYFIEQQRAGRVMLLSLVTNPFTPPEGFSCHGMIPRDDDGARVPILAEMVKLVGEELAALIPEKGLAPKAIHRHVDGTEWTGLGHFADWLHKETGCFQMDTSWDEMMYDPPQWNRELVDSLAADHRRAGVIQKAIDALAERLEKNPRAEFTALLRHLKRPVPAKPPKTLMEIFTAESDKEDTHADSHRDQIKNHEETGRLRPATRGDLAASARF